MLSFLRKRYPIAVIVVNYNMPERTNDLVEYLKKNVKANIDIYVVDNGSDLCEPSKYSNVFIKKNVQTCNGWLEGLRAADKSGVDYFAYMFIITSARFTSESHDPISPMIDKLIWDRNSVGVHPSLDDSSTTAWTHLKCRKTGKLRRTWMIDNICSLYRADWFNSIGRFDKRMIYAWGIDLETCYLARKQGRSLWVDDRVCVEKITDIAYDMNRMNMTAENRRVLAKKNMDDILSKKYGDDFLDLMLNAEVEEVWR